MFPAKFTNISELKTATRKRAKPRLGRNKSTLDFNKVTTTVKREGEEK
jgi:hypothetical protein